MSELSIDLIKSMDERQRKKLRAEELLIVILASDNVKYELFNTLNESVKSLNDTITFREEVSNNSVQIVTLNSKILLLQQENNILKTDIEDIHRRSRSNNIEIVGLPDPRQDSSDESMAMELFNELGLSDFQSDYIDACHVVPARRKDGRRVVVCRFVSRKMKEKVLLAKKGRRELKLEGNIYINEQLTPNNRKIFALTAAKKRELNYKFLWTKNGIVFLRKDEN